MEAASDWAFDRESPEQVTLSLIVLKEGRIIHERYAPGVDMTTKTRTWSTAKSIAVTLMGMLVDEGVMDLDAPLGFEWLPRAGAPEADPRNEITLRHVLNMSSGLDPVDNGLEYATGSGLAYWAGASSVEGARRRALIREPGTNWDYENYDTLLGVYAMRLALGRRIPGVPTQATPGPARDAEHLPERRPVRRFHPEQPGLHNCERPGAFRPTLPAGRHLEREAHDLRGLDPIRADASTRH